SEVHCWSSPAHGNVVSARDSFRVAYDSDTEVWQLEMVRRLPMPCLAVQQPDSLNHAEQKSGGQPKQQPSVQRLQRPHEVPVVLQIQIRVPVAGYRIQRIKHRGLVV